MSTAPPLRGGQARQDELLAATIEVLRETGYDGLTIDAVVARARASKSTVYRRWPNKSALVVAAFTEAVRHIPMSPDTGSLRDDLVILLDGLVAELDRLGDVVIGLIGETRRSPDLATAIRTGFVQARRETILGVFDRAKQRGEIPADVDADHLWYLAPSMVFFRMLLMGEQVDDTFARRVIDETVLPLVRPRT